MANNSERFSLRRSSRVNLRIPVVITGTYPDGAPFSEETFILEVSKYGARLKTRRHLEPGMQIKIRLKKQPDANLYRVVWAAQEDLTGLGEVGVECMEAPNSLGITFPE
jgi:PilZ domain-containing protein